MNVPLLCILASQGIMVYMISRMMKQLCDAQTQILDLRDEVRNRELKKGIDIGFVYESLQKIAHHIEIMKNALEYPSERLVRRPRSYVRKAPLHQTDSQESAAPSEKRSVGRPRKILQSSQETSMQPEL